MTDNAGRAERLTKIADACRREDGSDIPLGSEIRDAAAALTAAEAEIAGLRRENAEKQAAIDAAYVAMKAALRLGQISVHDIEAENPERQALRLQVFSALDMPTACLSGHTTRARSIHNKINEAGHDAG